MSRRSRSRNSAPPPVKTIPRSATSAASSGGVSSSACLMARTLPPSGSCNASSTSRRAFLLIGAAHFQLADFRRRIGAANFLLDAFCGRHTDDDAEIAAHIINNGAIKAVAADADGSRIDDAVQRNHRHFRRAAADIDHHGAVSLIDRNTGANRRRHRFLNQKDLASARALGGITDGALLHLGRAGRHTYQNTRRRTESALAAMRAVNKMLEHHRGNLEISDDAILQRPYRRQIARRAPQHLFRLRTISDNLLPPVLRIFRDRHHRRLIQNQSFTTHINQRVGSAQVNRQIAGKHPAKHIKTHKKASACKYISTGNGAIQSAI